MVSSGLEWWVGATQEAAAGGKLKAAGLPVWSPSAGTCHFQVASLSHYALLQPGPKLESQ